MCDVYMCRTCGIDWPNGEWRFAFSSPRRLHKHMELHNNVLGWWDHNPDPRSGRPPRVHPCR